MTTLPIALDLMSVFEIFAGRFRAAEAAIAEAEAILSFIGSRGHIGDPGLGELFLHAYRGDEDKARDDGAAQVTRRAGAGRRRRSRSRRTTRSPCSSWDGVATRRRSSTAARSNVNHRAVSLDARRADAHRGCGAV